MDYHYSWYWEPHPMAEGTSLFLKSSWICISGYWWQAWTDFQILSYLRVGGGISFLVNCCQLWICKHRIVSLCVQWLFLVNFRLWAPRGWHEAMEGPPSTVLPLPWPARDSTSPCSPVCWGSVTFPHWVTWTGDVLGTPSQPGFLAPQNCSGRHPERGGAFVLWIGLSPCLLSGECQTCDLWKVTETTGYC